MQLYQQAMSKCTDMPFNPTNFGNDHPLTVDIVLQLCFMLFQYGIPAYQQVLMRHSHTVDDGDW